MGTALDRLLLPGLRSDGGRVEDAGNGLADITFNHGTDRVFDFEEGTDLIRFTEGRRRACSTLRSAS